MNFIYKGKEVSIALNDKNDNELLIMDSKGFRIEEVYSRCRIESISKDVMIVTGFKRIGFDKTGREKYKFEELFFKDMKVLENKSS